MGTIYHCMKGFFIILYIGCSTILQRQTVFFRAFSILSAPPVDSLTKKIGNKFQKFELCHFEVELETRMVDCFGWKT